jgi:segregation and condensation protein B
VADFQKEIALIEAILYLESDPIDEGALSRISGLSKDMVKEALENLEVKYGAEDSGIELSRIGGGAMISPKREYWENLKDRYGRKNEGKISRAAMETLSIIAYRQPVTRAEIKGYRGVSPDNMIQLLLEKDLIRETGKKDVPGKPVQYGTTREFLKIFRLNSIAELPKLSEGDLDRFELEGEIGE